MAHRKCDPSNTFDGSVVYRQYRSVLIYASLSGGLEAMCDKRVIFLEYGYLEINAGMNEE